MGNGPSKEELAEKEALLAAEQAGSVVSLPINHCQQLQEKLSSLPPLDSTIGIGSGNKLEWLRIYGAIPAEDPKRKRKHQAKKRKTEKRKLLRGAGSSSGDSRPMTEPEAAAKSLEMFPTPPIPEAEVIHWASPEARRADFQKCFGMPATVSTINNTTTSTSTTLLLSTPLVKITMDVVRVSVTECFEPLLRNHKSSLTTLLLEGVNLEWLSDEKDSAAAAATLLAFKEACRNLPHLETLKLCQIGLDGGFWEEIAPLFATHSPLLKHVELEPPNRTSECTDMPVLQAMAASKSLQKLVIHWDEPLGGTASTSLFEPLFISAGQSSLQELSLLRSPYQDDCSVESIQPFLNFLRATKTLKRLTIPVQWELMTSIFQAMEDNVSVDFLYLNFLSCCYAEECQEPAIGALVQMVQRNTTLTQLNHRTNDGCPWLDDKYTIHANLQYNYARREYLPLDVDVMQAPRWNWWAAVVNVQEFPEMTYRLLSKNPGFISSSLIAGAGDPPADRAPLGVHQTEKA